MKPILKYSGSKFPYLSEIKEYFPRSFGNVFVPFLGGGSYLTLFKNKTIYASDINEHVISFFNYLKSHKDILKDSYTRHYENCLVGKSDYYDEVKASFNNSPQPTDFLFLTRTCYNGLIRYNKAGKFNVGFHHNRNGIHPDKMNQIIDDWYKLIVQDNNVEFYYEDYKDTLIFPQSQHFVILDPPYINTKGQYHSVGFDFEVFEYELNVLTRNGVFYLVTLDHGVEKVQETLPQLRKVFWHKTSSKSSSFSRLKLNSIEKGNTVILNYRKTY